MTDNQEIPIWDRRHGSELCRLWCYVCDRANPTDRTVSVGGHPVAIKAGQFITGRHKLHKALYPNEDQDDPHPDTVWKWLKRLERLGGVVTASTKNYTLVTVCNWETYKRPVINDRPQKQEKTACEQNLDSQPVTDVSKVKSSRCENVIAKKSQVGTRKKGQIFHTDIRDIYKYKPVAIGEEKKEGISGPAPSPCPDQKTQLYDWFNKLDTDTEERLKDENPGVNIGHELYSIAGEAIKKRIPTDDLERFTFDYFKKLKKGALC